MSNFSICINEYVNYEASIYDDIIEIKVNELNNGNIESSDYIRIIPEDLDKFVKFINEIPHQKQLAEELYSEDAYNESR